MGKKKILTLRRYIHALRKALGEDCPLSLQCAVCRTQFGDVLSLSEHEEQAHAGASRGRQAHSEGPP